MRTRRVDVTASQLHDGEIDASSVEIDDDVRAELKELARLSAALVVPPERIRRDPFFVVRFRHRRDEMRAALVGAQPWRRVALRLLPLAAGALIAAGAVIGMSSNSSNLVRDLEQELAGGRADVSFETASVEPVLRIALGEL